MDAPLAGATSLDRLQRSTRNVRRIAGTSRHKGIRLSSSPPTAWYTSARAADGAADRRIGSPQLPGHDRLCGTIRSIDLAEPAALPTSTRSMPPVNSLRVLWLSPWIRPPARVQAEALRQRGVDVLLVTSDQHPESDAARDYELVLDPRFRTASNWPATLAALRRIRKYRPHVVIAELVGDPRWVALAGLAPRMQLVHDSGLHDTAERRPAYEGAATIAPLGSTVRETISCQNGCKSFITYAIVCRGGYTI
jgi:hypothetical protein